MTKTKKKSPPTHTVVVDNGGRFTGTDGKQHTRERGDPGPPDVHETPDEGAAQQAAI